MLVSAIIFNHNDALSCKQYHSLFHNFMIKNDFCWDVDLEDVLISVLGQMMKKEQDKRFIHVSHMLKLA